MRKLLSAVAALATGVMLIASDAPPPPDEATPTTPQKQESSSTPSAPGRVIERNQGDPERAADFRDGVWRFDDMAIPTALPAGYPAPTPPEVIEIKQYPSVRRAEVSAESTGPIPQNQGFWPLFLHIERNDIPMTSPVEMEIESWGHDDQTPRRWTMAFLYRTPDEGPTGTDGRVVIRDAEPVTVIAIGAKGPIATERYTPLLQTLQNWLADSTQWEQAGDPRWLGYNGPEMPRPRQWGEVQIPIRKVDTPNQGKSSTE